ncbi:hypothetical protein NDU88_006529 [Pleurodeles waltl]|uniref:Uncharacterized protein n=1 Tax=Pleurodeles waltl TaxID=8319 RepID=A0AAV7TY30_PLEWA|nr:hypothetical protein NDU88_006529 [Pleurodeles waltl]
MAGAQHALLPWLTAASRANDRLAPHMVVVMNREQRDEDDRVDDVDRFMNARIQEMLWQLQAKQEDLDNRSLCNNI